MARSQKGVQKFYMQFLLQVGHRKDNLFLFLFYSRLHIVWHFFVFICIKRKSGENGLSRILRKAA
jgi:hypothetical protein